MKNRRKIIASVGASLLVAGALAAGPLTSASGQTAKPVPAGTASQVFGAFVSVAPGANGLASVSCGAGRTLTGGGGQTSAFSIFLTDSYASGATWFIRGTNRGGATESIRAFAVCLGLF